MDDGLYVSVYLHVDPLSNAIGWWQRHDQNLSLWEKEGDQVRLVRYWELERLTGLKQHWLSIRDKDQAQSLLECLLEREQVKLTDIRGVFGTPGLDTLTDYDSSLEFPTIPYHTVCHLFSAMAIDGYPIGDRQMIALALDGGPDRVVDHAVAYAAEYAVAIVRDGSLTIEPVSISPGRLWYLARQRFGMREGSLMALQTASSARFQWHSLSADDLRSFSGIHAYLEKAWDQIEATSPDDLGNVQSWDSRFTTRENQISMATKLLHEVSTNVVESIVTRAISDYDIDPTETVLAVSGGYALNCPSNSQLLRKFGFADFCAPPCVNDAGISLGAALFQFWKSNPRTRFLLRRVDLGPSASPTWMTDLPPQIIAEISVSELNEEQVVDDIIASPVVWFDSGCEIGPRALGFRSLLGDPRYEITRSLLNSAKQREWWRPVAPIVIETEGASWFENFRRSPHMLLTLSIRNGMAAKVPAVVHLDGSARVQSASPEQLPLLSRVLTRFHQRTGVPMLANTSLNDKGEPMILSPEHALLFAARKKIRVAYVTGMRIEISERAASVICECVPSKREFSELGRFAANDDLLALLNPHGVSLFALQTYCRLPILQLRFNLANGEDAQEVERLCGLIRELRHREYGTTAHSAYLMILQSEAALST